jgi:hypothetical protein
MPILHGHGFGKQDLDDTKEFRGVMVWVVCDLAMFLLTTRARYLNDD